MKSFAQVIIAALAIGTVIAAPTPAPQDAPTAAAPNTGNISLEVPCGCWNDCSLNALVGIGMGSCTMECDPRYMCPNTATVMKRQSGENGDISGPFPTWPKTKFPPPFVSEPLEVRAVHGGMKCSLNGPLVFPTVSCQLEITF